MTSAPLAVARRLAGVAVLAGLGAFVSDRPDTARQSLVHLCCGYSPARLAAGTWWTVPGSALVIEHFHLLGISAAVILAALAVSALRHGSGRTVLAFFTGHVLATLAVAAVVLPAAALGWHPAEVVRVRADLGASAGVAGVAGAVAVSLGRGRGTVLGAAFAAFFAVHLVVAPRLADVEHLIALAAGAVLGRRWRRSWPAGIPVSSTVHGGGGTLAWVRGVTKRSRSWRSRKPTALFRRS